VWHVWFVGWVAGVKFWLSRAGRRDNRIGGAGIPGGVDGGDGNTLADGENTDSTTETLIRRRKH
jgi:hypothetical protein